MDNDDDDSREREAETTEHKTTEHKTEKTENYMALGMAAGFALGAAFSFTITDSIIYAPVGMLFGLAIGAGIRKKPKE